MRLSDLRDFFDDKISAVSLHDLIVSEVRDYQSRALTKGVSNPITVTNDAEIIISPKSISYLCSAYLQGDLGEAELSYVADALLLSNFANDIACIGEGLTTLVGLLTDPEVNGKISRERVLDVLTQLSLNSN